MHKSWTLVAALVGLAGCGSDKWVDIPMLDCNQLETNRAAERLAMHRRTLNRRLEARGTSLRQLVEETRFEIARQLIEYTGMPFVEISGALGYADASAFTRAFRRWAGTNPARWREDAWRRRGVNCQAPPGAAGYTGPARDQWAPLGRS